MRPRGKGVQCRATTRDGSQCPTQAPQKTGLCHLHDYDKAPQCERVNRQTRQQCRNRAVRGGRYCSVHDYTHRPLRRPA